MPNRTEGEATGVCGPALGFRDELGTPVDDLTIGGEIVLSASE